MKSFIFFIAILFIVPRCFSQDGSTDQQLAQYYFSKGEYEKAVDYYEKLFSKDASTINFNRYYECLLKTNQPKEAEKLIKKQISKESKNWDLRFMLAEFYEENARLEDADEIYKDALNEIKNNPTDVLVIYQAFKQKGKYDYALEALEKGRKIFKSNYPLHFYFADIYFLTNKPEKMIDEYLDLLSFQTNMLENIQNSLAKQIDFTVDNSVEYDLLKQRVLEKIQKNPEEEVYTRLLTWIFIQKKNFNAAITQSIALDKRIKGKGRNVYELGKICIENKEFKAARRAFQYVMDLGYDGILFYEAEEALLNSQFIEVTQNRNYSKNEIDSTILDYKKALSQPGRKRIAIPMVLELAVIEAFYGNQADSAIQLLEEELQIPSLTDMQKAEIKIKLGDILVLKGEIWDASIYYMQVDKDFKFEPIGHEAKFKNARIFYYDGEFDFAQSQLNVLKESTSKLISNDAMDLSILITENYGLDSNYEAMMWFALGDLLVEQHLYEQANQYFDSLTTKYPYHSLSDEILMKKAISMEKQGLWEKAIPFLEDILKYNAEDILADDALFKLGLIYDEHLNDKEKASELYKRLLFEYKGSLHVIEARKRFRIIRGDKLDPEDLN